MGGRSRQQKNKDRWDWVKELTDTRLQNYISPGSVVAVRGPQKGTEEQWSMMAEMVQESVKPSLVLHFGRKVDYIRKNVLFFPLRSRK